MWLCWMRTVPCVAGLLVCHIGMVAGLAAWLLFRTQAVANYCASVQSSSKATTKQQQKPEAQIPQQSSEPQESLMRNILPGTILSFYNSRCICQDYQEIANPYLLVSLYLIDGSSMRNGEKSSLLCLPKDMTHGGSSRALC